MRKVWILFFSICVEKRKNYSQSYVSLVQFLLISTHLGVQYSMKKKIWLLIKLEYSHLL